MKADELIHHVTAELRSCAGYEGDEIAKDRVSALDAYLMRPNGTEIKGRSTAVSGDVSAMVEANLSAMLEAFQSSDRLIEFDPLGPDDVEQAQLESDACVHYVMGENNGAWQIAQAVKDALTVRNGWVKSWVEIEKDVRTEEYDNVEPEALIELTANPDVECKVLEYENKHLKVQCTYTTKRFRSEAVAPENIFYPRNFDGCDYRALQRIPFIAERHEESRSEAIKRGFAEEKVNRLRKVSASVNSTSRARNPRKSSAQSRGVDKMAEIIEWYESYVMIDGKREKVCFSENELLAREPHNGSVPYATAVVLIAPHRLTGYSIWDKCRHSQDINTQLTRGLLDNVAATSRNRLVYQEGRVDPDDIADGRVNGAIQVSKHVVRVSDAVMPLAVPDTSSGIQAAIQHQRQIRTELGGAALDMASGNMQLQKQVGSMGLDRAYSVAEQLAAHMTKNVAASLIRSMFLIAHDLLREHFDKPVPIYKNGDWYEVIPANWVKRERVQVRPGMSPGERTRRQATLDKMLQTQIQFFQLGLEDVLVDPSKFHALLLDWARVSDVQMPERYYLDPNSDGAKQAMKSKAEEAKQMQDMQAQLVAQAVDLKKLETALDKYVADQKTQLEYWKGQEETRRAEAEIAGRAAIEMIKQEGDDGDGSPNAQKQQAA